MEENSEIAIRIEESASVRTLHIAGTVSIASAPTLQQALLESLGRSPSTVVDLSAVSGMDLSGLQLLHSARQTWRRTGAQLDLSGAPEWLVRLAAETGFGLLRESSSGEAA